MSSIPGSIDGQSTNALANVELQDPGIVNSSPRQKSKPESKNWFWKRLNRPNLNCRGRRSITWRLKSTLLGTNGDFNSRKLRKMPRSQADCLSKPPFRIATFQLNYKMTGR